MFLLRPARESDLPKLLELARHLDSLNLPADEELLARRLDRSATAFASEAPPSEDREYQFVLEGAAGEVVGTCAILAKHGTPESPHFYLEVGEEERRAESLDVTARHVTLRLRRATNGPTEIGALVLHPFTRGQPGRVGPANLGLMTRGDVNLKYGNRSLAISVAPATGRVTLP